MRDVTKNGGKIACFSKDNFGLFNALFGLNVSYDTRMEQFMNSKYCNFVFS